MSQTLSEWRLAKLRELKSIFEDELISSEMYEQERATVLRANVIPGQGMGQVAAPNTAPNGQENTALTTAPLM